ncbi:P13 family porin [Borrelia sp. HM]|uniref:P13 family porin n=1 Tax=Borrelia sp. HM TaxID=1882662 RepID=UPI001C789D7F|nr:P13 family porin [Borrelia sp. HM]BCR21482.1 hypothetical protein BKFM_00042 [Borrelia sp. HM]
MKRILILMLFFSCVFVSFAQSNNNGNAFDEGERFLFYENNKTGTLFPFILNATVGFGLGSFIQGDLIGGISLFSCDALGAGLLAYGLYSRYQFDKLPDTQKESEYKMGLIALSLIGIGGSAMLITRIVGMILPFTYANSVNKKLQEDLAIELGGFKPTFDVSFQENSGLGFEFAFVKKY